MAEVFKVIIAGGRDFNDYELLRDQCEGLINAELQRVYAGAPEPEVIIISGGARGADALGYEFAKDCGLQCDFYMAQWDKYGKSAGYRRNDQMADVGNMLIAFWDGQSRGTKHMIDLAHRKRLIVHVVNY